MTPLQRTIDPGPLTVGPEPGTAILDAGPEPVGPGPVTIPPTAATVESLAGGRWSPFRLLDDPARRIAIRYRVAVSSQRGQGTVEYALVLLGAAAVALALVAWVARSGAIGRLFDSVVGRVLRSAG